MTAVAWTIAALAAAFGIWAIRGWLTETREHRDTLSQWQDDQARHQDYRATHQQTLATGGVIQPSPYAVRIGEATPGTVIPSPTARCAKLIGDPVRQCVWAMGHEGQCT